MSEVEELRRIIADLERELDEERHQVGVESSEADRIEEVLTKRLKAERRDRIAAVDREVAARYELDRLRAVIRQTIGPDPESDDGFTFLWPEYDNETKALIQSIIWEDRA